MNKRKKILFLINTLSSGGAEKALIDIANNLDKDKLYVKEAIVDMGSTLKRRVPGM